LDAVARETFISVEWLRALEDGQIGALPQSVYIRGWLEHIADF